MLLHTLRMPPPSRIIAFSCLATIDARACLPVPAWDERLGSASRFRRSLHPTAALGVGQKFAPSCHRGLGGGNCAQGAVRGAEDPILHPGEESLHIRRPLPLATQQRQLGSVIAVILRCGSWSGDTSP